MTALVRSTKSVIPIPIKEATLKLGWINLSRGKLEINSAEGLRNLLSVKEIVFNVGNSQSI